ncbi:LKR [Mytilus coruscus]|uniref:LKR n=1 Tax=Mytilus coruscus TaxID=42192 RepID=A0A6J8A2R0_MYTCO|nr:LKR [Mytilus coruscus]
MSDVSELKSMFSDFPENLTIEELQYLEHLRYNLSKKYEPISVSTGILTVLVLLYGSISVIAVIGNALVIFVVLYKRNMQTVTNVFIANLALADVALGVFTIPFQFHAAIMQRWVVADFMCKVAPFVKNLSVNVSILTLTVIAFDRYIAVMYPLRAGFRKQVAIIVLLVIWVLSTSSSIPDLLYYKVNIIFDIEIWAKKPFCEVQWPSDAFPKFYFSYFLLLQYMVPLTIISFSYIRVAYRIWGSKAPGYEIQRRDHIRSVHKKKNIVNKNVVELVRFGN